MMSSAIKPYSIRPIANLQLDEQLTAALLTSVAEYLPYLRGRRIWLACSGGRDSLALAALCAQLYRQQRLPFLPQLLHVDHGLQADSSHWAQHVASWAKAQQLPCRILQVEVQGCDEQAARQARYQAMLSQINQNDVLLLAHHADDQAETVLMRLIQGAGVKGLSGMQLWRVQLNGTRQNVLWRPWLTIRRQTISAYAERLQLPYIDDPTNDSGDNVRSSLRRDVLPALAAYNANAVDNIARSAQLLAEAQATVSAQATRDCQQATIDQLDYPPAQRVLDIDKLDALPVHRQRQLLHYWLAQDEPLPPAKQLIDDVLNLSQRDDNNHQTQLCWQARKQTYTIRRYRQQLYRLSQSWLDWLLLPIVERTQVISTVPFNTNILHNSHNVHSIDLSQTRMFEFNLRTDDNYSWQLSVIPAAIAQLLNHQSYPDYQGELTLRVAPLGRAQYLQTALTSRAQAGKKLYQTLGIPIWLRNSLVVVSAVFNHVNQVDSTDNELPILLISPFTSWVLGSNQPIAEQIENMPINMMENSLQIKD